LVRSLCGGFAALQALAACWPCCCCLAVAVANQKDMADKKKTLDFAQFQSLAEFGYGFNQRGELRQIAADGEPTERPFQFEVKAGSRSYNQRHYEALGEVLTKEIYRLLEAAGLQRLPLPGPAVLGDDEESIDTKDSEEGDDDETTSGSFIFASPDYGKKASLLVLIHGSGVVRAGQWARRLIINENLG
jgi:hypothetical protein